MRKRTFVILAAITILVLGGIALGVGRMQVASAHAQTTTVQTQLNNQQGGLDQETRDDGAAVNGTVNDPPDPGESTGSAEDQGQDQNLPGGGHQDQGQVDHQFEGTE
ncbi:MAG TPA: hypothetical protein VFZ02_02780 [Ktedonobacteraceae bacterium]